MQKIFNVKIEEGESGIWFATSEDEPAMFIAAASIDELLAGLPRILRTCLSNPTENSRS